MMGGRKRRGSTQPPQVYTVNEAEGTIVVRPRKTLLERKPSIAGRASAFDRLHKELAAATEVYLHRGDGGREGVYDTTVALFEYLTSRGIPHAALEPLIAIQTAIVDADQGVESQVFKAHRTSTGGKPPASDMQRAVDAKLAIVMECCVRHCRVAKMRPFIRPAADLAAKMINKSDWPVKVTARELEELRERMRQSSPHPFDRTLFEVAFKSGIADSSPLEWAQAFVERGWSNPRGKVSG